MRVRSFLLEKGIFSQEEIDGMGKEADQAVQDAVDYGMSCPEPFADSLERDVYAGEYAGVYGGGFDAGFGAGREA